MQNFFLQIGSSSSLQDSFSEGLGSIVSKITPALPHDTFITTLAIIMIIGAVVTLAFFKIKQPMIIGYLFAGMLIGPLLPLLFSYLPTGQPNAETGVLGILADTTVLNLFAEIGVILLLFVIGMEFPFAKIRSIGKVAVGVGTLGLISTMGVVFYASLLLGLNFMDALFIAAALSISSTAIIVKIFEDANIIKRESSVLVLGILIVEDIIAVILIASLESIAIAGTVSIESVIPVLIVAVVLIVGTFTIGRKVIPHLTFVMPLQVL